MIYTAGLFVGIAMHLLHQKMLSFWSPMIEVASFISLILYPLSIVLLIFLFLNVGSRKLKQYVVGIYLSIFLSVNMYLAYFIGRQMWVERRYSEVEEIKTCEIATTTFERDAKQGEMKYFLFGMGESIELSHYLTNECGLDVYHMGCVVTEPLICYNRHVEERFDREYGISIIACLKE